MAAENGPWCRDFRMEELDLVVRRLRLLKGDVKVIGLCQLAKCVRAEICLIELPALLSCAIPCHALRARSWHNFDRPTGALALHQTARGVRTARVICTENLPEMRT